MSAGRGNLPVNLQSECTTKVFQGQCQAQQGDVMACTKQSDVLSVLKHHAAQSCISVLVDFEHVKIHSES